MTPQDLLPFLDHLHRGGTYGYWWTGNDKRSHWWKVSQPTALPAGRDNIYVGVHPTSAIPPINTKGEAAPPTGVRSQIAYIAAINCVFAEYDAKHFTGGKSEALAHINALPLPPSVIIDSGGGYHCYWFLQEPFILSTEADRIRADRAQKGWVKLVGSDDGAKDLARVLRVPGTRNYKAAYKPDYPAVEIVRADYERLYDLTAVEALIPAPPDKQPGATRRRAATATTNNQDETGNDADLGMIATVAQQLQRLSTERRDQYTGWLQVGMALRGLGAIGFELWELWSKGSPKYHAGVCAEKWQTFTRDAGITIASLSYWADVDDPPTTPSATPTAPEMERLQREVDDHKHMARWTRGVLQSDLDAPAKVTLLGVGPQLDACRVLATGPSSPLPISYDHISAMTNQSPSTISRTVRKLEAARVWQCAPDAIASPAGYTMTPMRVVPLPAFDDPTLIQPVPSANTHGGKRERAGRKPRCATCPAGTPLQETITETRQTTVRYSCQGCGEILEERTGKPITIVSSTVIDTSEQAAWEALEVPNNQDETEVEPFSLLSADAPIAAHVADRPPDDVPSSPDPLVAGDWQVVLDGVGWRGRHATLGRTGLYPAREGAERAIDWGNYGP